MLNINVLFEILKPDYALRWLHLLLLVAILPLLDAYIMLLSASYMGPYLFLALLAFLMLLGFFISRHMVIKNLRLIKDKTGQYSYAEYEYNMLPATLVLALFLIMPGLLSTIFALIVSIPALRYRLGKALTSYLRIDWKEIHEFLNIVE